MYRTEWVNAHIGDRSVTDLAISIHGACCGSGEYYQNFWDDVRAIEWIVGHWEKSISPYSRFDEAVRELLIAAAAEAHASHWAADLSPT